MKIRVLRLATALAIAAPLAMAAAAKSSAAPMDGTPIKVAAPAVTTDVRYREYRDYPYSWDWGYPAYYYYGDRNYWTYSPYRPYPGYYYYNWW